MLQTDDHRELDLLDQVIAGSSGAWSEFYSRYERLVIACIRKVLVRYGVGCPQQDLDDLVNTVCLQLVQNDYQKLRLFDPEKGYRLSSWVGLIATNTAHDALRRRGPVTYSLDDQDSTWLEQPSEQPSPDDLALLRERQEVLNRAVGRLSPSEQLFLRYYYLERRSPEEIASLLGISINTVYSRKNKIRTSLKRSLGGMKIE